MDIKDLIEEYAGREGELKAIENEIGILLMEKLGLAADTISLKNITLASYMCFRLSRRFIKMMENSDAVEGEGSS